MGDYDYLSPPQPQGHQQPVMGQPQHAPQRPVMLQSVMVRCGRCGVPCQAFGGVQWATCGSCGMLNAIHPSMWWAQPQQQAWT